jgi:hypothetical protein
VAIGTPVLLTAAGGLSGFVNPMVSSNLTAGIGAGNVIVVFVGTQAVSETVVSVTDSQGNFYQQAGSGGSTQWTEAWVCLNNLKALTTSDTITVQFSNNGFAAHFHAIGCTGVMSSDICLTSSATTGSPSRSTGTLGQASELVLGWNASANGSGAISWNSPMTPLGQLHIGSNMWSFSSYDIVSVNTSVNVSGSYGTASNTMMALTLRGGTTAVGTGSFTAKKTTRAGSGTFTPPPGVGSFVAKKPAFSGSGVVGQAVKTGGGAAGGAFTVSKWARAVALVPAKRFPAKLTSHLGNLAPPAAFTPGTGIELRVLAGTNFMTPLGYCNDFLSLQFVPMLNDKGSGSTTLRWDDPAVLNSFIADGVSASPAAASTDPFSLPLPDAVASALGLGARFRVTSGPGAGLTVYTVTQVGTTASGGVRRVRTNIALPAFTTGSTVTFQTRVGPALLSYENLFQCIVDGKVVFEFLNESPAENLVSQDESKEVTVTGPGTAQCLTWGRAMPPGWPTPIYKTGAIADPFTETTLDTTFWNQTTAGAVSLDGSGTATILARPSPGAVLGGGLFNFKGTSISAQVQPLVQGQNLDGSEVTQMYVAQTPATSFVSPLTSGQGYAMIALSGSAFYCQYSTSKGRVQTKVMADYDPSQHAYWRISEDSGVIYYWTSPDGSSWVKQWQVKQASDPWDPSVINLFFLAAYDVTNQQSVLVSNLNSDVQTPPSFVNVFQNTAAMDAFWQLLDACRRRGTVPFITTSFTRSRDSALFGWSDSQTFEVTNGQDLYTLLTNYVGTVNADWRMRPGFVLDVGLPGSIGRDLSQKVVLYDGSEAISKSRTAARDQVANMVAGVDVAGKIWTEQNQTSKATWRQREWWVDSSTALDAPSTDAVVQATLAQLDDEASSRTLTIQYGVPGKSPFKDFDVGDWVGVERSDYAREALRVIGIAVSVDQDGNVTCELTLETYRQYLDIQLQYLINKFGGQFASTLGALPSGNVSAGGVASSNLQPAPSLGGLSDVAAPSPGANETIAFNPKSQSWEATSTIQTPLLIGSQVLAYAVQAPRGPVVFDFEGTTGTSADLQGWFAVSGTLATNATWSTTGAQSALLTPAVGPSPVASTPIGVNGIPVMVGDPVAVSVDVTTPNANPGSVYVGVQWYDAAGNFVYETDSLDVTTPAGWSGTVQVQDNAPVSGYVAIVFGSHGAGTSDGLIFADNIQIAGNLVYSTSPTGGTDSVGNVYDQGLEINAQPGMTSVLTVQDAWGENTLASIDSSGNITGQVVSGTDVSVGGQSLVSEILPSVPMGIIAYGRPAQSTEYPTVHYGTTAGVVLEVSCDMEAGRAYQVVLENITWESSTAGHRTFAFVRYTTDGSAPTTSSTILMQPYWDTGETNFLRPATNTAMFFPTSNCLFRAILCVSQRDASPEFTQVDDAAMYVVDMGAAPANNYSYLGATNVTSAGGTTSKKQYVTTWTCLHTYAYEGSDGRQPNTKINTDGKAYQGGNVSDTNNGRSKTFILMPSSIASTLAGSSISQTEVFLNNNHCWYNSGMSAAIGWSASTDFTGNQGDPTGHDSLATPHFNEGQQQWVTVPGLGVAFRDSGARCVTLFHNGNELMYYGYFAGGGSSTPPKMRITYTK